MQDAPPVTTLHCKFEVGRFLTQAGVEGLPKQRGIPRERLNAGIPVFRFGKTLPANLELFAQKCICCLAPGFAVACGRFRKSMIGQLAGSAVASVLAGGLALATLAGGPALRINQGP